MSTDDRLIIRSPLRPGQYRHDLSLEVYGPDIRTGIVPFCQNFGQLYHGKISQQVWTAKFAEEKKLLLTDMWGQSNSPGIIDDIDFKLELIALARQEQSWKFPVLLDVSHNGLNWVNGHSRLLASGICWSRAWDRVNFLLFVPHDQNISAFSPSFQAVDRITDDQQLRTVLGALMSNDEPWLINAGFETVDRKVIFRLRSIQDNTDRAICRERGQYFRQWQSWLSDNLSDDLVINVNVSNIGAITDSSGRWTINHLGPPPDQLVSYAQMSARIFHQKQVNDNDSAWSLYHFCDEQLDLGEFFFFLDQEHSVLHTQDWRTILVKPGGFFKCREISVSGT